MHVLSISSLIRRTHSFRGCPRMKRTTVLEVPTPPSPSPAPSRLRRWLAHDERISILRSTALSMLNTPTNTPAGDMLSSSGGGNMGGVKFAGSGCGKDAVVGMSYEGGAVENWGMVQYPRHGNGSLSGFRM